MADTIVIGIGNPLLGDDGIGVRLAHDLAAECAGDEVEFADAGGSGMRVLHLLAGKARAILIDCALMDAEPGALHRFTPDDIAGRNVLAHLSTHEGNLLEILDLSRRLGELPAEVILFGIQPADLTPGAGLSATLIARLPAYRHAIIAELR